MTPCANLSDHDAERFKERLGKLVKPKREEKP
jgi:hypothetical protein